MNLSSRRENRNFSTPGAFPTSPKNAEVAGRSGAANSGEACIPTSPGRCIPLFVLNAAPTLWCPSDPRETAPRIAAIASARPRPSLRRPEAVLTDLKDRGPKPPWPPAVYARRWPQTLRFLLARILARSPSGSCPWTHHGPRWGRSPACAPLSLSGVPISASNAWLSDRSGGRDEI